MKHYIVYVGAQEVGIITAGSHNAAEKKAAKRWKKEIEQEEKKGCLIPLSVEYTEL